jgi:hypothetical protein
LRVDGKHGGKVGNARERSVCIGLWLRRLFLACHVSYAIAVVPSVAHLPAFSTFR